MLPTLNSSNILSYDYKILSLYKCCAQGSYCSRNIKIFIRKHFILWGIHNRTPPRYYFALHSSIPPHKIQMISREIWQLSALCLINIFWREGRMFVSEADFIHWSYTRCRLWSVWYIWSPYCHGLTCTYPNTCKWHETRDVMIKAGIEYEFLFVSY